MTSVSKALERFGRRQNLTIRLAAMTHRANYWRDVANERTTMVLAAAEERKQLVGLLEEARGYVAAGAERPDNWQTAGSLLSRIDDAVGPRPLRFPSADS